jgi:serine/threonine-protein kinase
MLRPNADTDLLFGILALQNGLIDPPALIAAFQAWKTDRSRGIAQILRERGSLSDRGRRVIELLVEEHARMREAIPTQTTLSVSLSPELRKQLSAIDDELLDASLEVIDNRAAPFANPLSLPVSSVGMDGSTLTAAPREAAWLGERFRVLRPHAQGGLGAVYVAIDDELHREVALKQIREEHADHVESRARFVLEAEITGGLEHPGIVPVYSLGHDDFGRPFYAMRFIRGDSLNDAIESFHRNDQPGREPGERALATQKLLRRFLDVCNAISYAHSRGVLHRDLKPGNILVGRYGETLVVDWGLAKVVGTREPTGEATLRPNSISGSTETLPGSALGTPAYMSPEQAAGRLEELGATSDVYGLGATLYCLLTGRPPFAKGDLAHTLERVQKGDFPSPRFANPKVPRALEAVCLKAMSLRPGDRYPTARELADDIERWLADEPVKAYREPWLDHMRRWARRHRPAVASIVALVGTSVLALSIGLAIVAHQRNLIEKARTVAQKNFEVAQSNFNRAEAERSRAEANLHRAREAVDRYFVQVSRARLLNEPGMQPLRRELLESAVDYYRRIAAEQGDDPRSRADIGMALGRLAQIAAELDGAAEGLKQNAASIETLEPLLRQYPTDQAIRSHLANALYNQARYLAALNRTQEAEQTIKRSIEIRETLIANAPNDAEDIAKLASALDTLASLLARTARKVEAATKYDESLRLRRRVVSDAPANTDGQAALASGIYNLALLHRDLGDIAACGAEMKTALDIRSRLVETHPNVIEYRSSLVYSLGELAGLYHAFLNQPAEAEPYYRQAIEEAQRLVDQNPNVSAFRRDLAVILNNMSWLESALGRPDAARAISQRAVAAWRELVAKNPSVSDYQAALGDAILRSATLRDGPGDAGGGRSEASEAWSVFDSVAKQNPDVLIFPIKRAMADSVAANAAIAAGVPDEARALLDRAVETLESVLEKDKRNAIAQDSLNRLLAARADLASRAGNLPAALADLDRAAKTSEGMVRESISLVRALALARAGDVGQAEGTLSQIKLDELDRSGILGPGGVALRRAAFHAVLARSLKATNRVKAESEFASVLTLLREADKNAAFPNSESLRVFVTEHSDFEVMRDRDDYQQLVKSLAERLSTHVAK